eukprot:6539223-Pyramimonas_sp.AAC.1
MEQWIEQCRNQRKLCARIVFAFVFKYIPHNLNARAFDFERARGISMVACPRRASRGHPRTNEDIKGHAGASRDIKGHPGTSRDT